MPAPALRIPVSLDLDSLREQTEKASSHVGQTLRLVGSQFAKLNGEAAAGSAAAAGAVASGWLGAGVKIIAAIGAARLAIGAAAIAMGAAINEALKQLQEMVDIAEKASARGVSAEFFQGFVSEARKARVQIAELEEALKRAFDALKPTADLSKPFVDLDRGTTGVIKKITEVETLLGQLFLELFDKSQGTPVFLREFQQAGDSVQGQIRAVLTAMIELEQAGQRLAALALGEKVFGAELVNRIRQGKTSAEELRASLDKPPPNIFSQEQVDRAAEVSRQLKVAHDTLERNLRPAWEGLADIALTIKSVWADIVGLIARAASVTSVFGSAAAKAQQQQQLEEVNRRLAGNEGAFGLPLSNAGRKQLEKLQARLLKETGFGNQGFEPTFAPEPSAGVPLPSRRPDDAPKAKEEKAASRDSFERAADTVEKRTAGLVAETAALDLSTEARARAKLAAELETVAMQANATAGLQVTEVTASQRARIDEIAAAYGRAAAAAENARSPLATFARDAANLGKSLNQFAASSLDTMTNELAALATGSKTAAEAFRAMAQSIINDLARIAIRQSITGPLASLLFGAGGGAGGIFSVVGRNAGGTDDWRGGPTWVGESGPEIINAPRGAQIIPNHVLSRMGGRGGPNVTYAPTYHFDAGIGPADMALIETQIAASEQRTRADVTGIVRGDLAHDRDALGI